MSSGKEVAGGKLLQQLPLFYCRQHISCILVHGPICSGVHYVEVTDEDPQKMCEQIVAAVMAMNRKLDSSSGGGSRGSRASGGASDTDGSSSSSSSSNWASNLIPDEIVHNAREVVVATAGAARPPLTCRMRTADQPVPTLPCSTSSCIATCGWRMQGRTFWAC